MGRFSAGYVSNEFRYLLGNEQLIALKWSGNNSDGAFGRTPQRAGRHLRAVALQAHFDESCVRFDEGAGCGGQTGCLHGLARELGAVLARVQFAAADYGAPLALTFARYACVMLLVAGVFHYVRVFLGGRAKHQKDAQV